MKLVESLYKPSENDQGSSRLKLGESIVLSTEEANELIQLRNLMSVVIMDIIHYDDLIQPGTLRKIDDYVASIADLEYFLNYFSKLREICTKFFINQLVPDSSSIEETSSETSTDKLMKATA